MNTIQIGPFLGINNKLPDFALHVEGNGDYLVGKYGKVFVTARPPNVFVRTR